jgi:hypothetical protein
VDWEPLVALVPDQAPDAAQEVALMADQVRVALPPRAIVLGLADKLTVGAGALTETVADCVALPPAPVQVSAYVVLAVIALLDCEPLIALLPDQPPEAVQAVVLVDDQVSVVVAPLLTVLGAAERLTVGAGVLTDTVADCVALPPVPVQVSPKVSLALIAPVDCEPLTALLPDHAPEALHEVALADDQVKVELAPFATVLGLALMLTVAVGFGLTVTVVD